jgi:alpha-methylacyl-CoA racemase
LVEYDSGFDISGDVVAGPLEGIRIIEMAGVGPGPFAGMMLADHGAEVIRIDRPDVQLRYPEILARSRKSIVVDLKQAEGVALIRRLARSAHGLFEGLRPGVMERLGLGPEVLLADNPALIYGRMTGWGQEGPLAPRAGHDINYIALSGALHASGRAGAPPTPPMNLVGDFGGGGMMMAFGMVAALLNARLNGRGQVIDCAMVDGASLLMSATYAYRARGVWRDERGTNLLDSGAHFYDCYETADGRHVAIGSIEPQFYAKLRAKLGIVADPEFDAQRDPKQWPRLKEKLAAVFRQKTLADWTELFEGSDACFSPVLTMAEAPLHEHNVFRGTFVDVHGAVQPAPAPRFSATPSAPPGPEPQRGNDTDAVLRDLGCTADEVEVLRHAGIIS